MPLDASQVQWDEVPQQPKPRLRYDAPENVEAIRTAATDLGIDPVDLATAISYETAGTFDPDQPGPTTKWGQHRGLIQFGEPQRAKYGVREGMTIPEQMPAVVAYLRDAGVKPGMGMLDVYSAINAGGPGRYNASDTAAGGAPGTVADKVNTQMGAHRKRAEALLGGMGGGGGTGGIDLSKVQWDAPAASAPSAGPEMRATPEPTFLGSVGEAFQTLIGNREGSYERPLISRIQDAGGQVVDAITPDAFQRGLRRGEQGFMAATGGMMPETIYGPDADRARTAVEIANLEREAGRYPQSQARADALSRISQAPTIAGAAGEAFRNPAAIADVILESLGVAAPQLAMTAIGSVAGPVGTAATSGAGSFATEYGQTVLSAIQDTGVDLGDSMAVSRALSNPELMAKAREDAVQRGVPIAIFDALTAGVAGQLVKRARGLTQGIGAAAGEAGIQAAGGMAGETAAQLSDEGQITSPGEILLEGVAELPTAVVEVPANLAEARARARAAPEATPVIDPGQVQWDEPAPPSNGIPPTPDNSVPPTPSAPVVAAPPSAGPDTSPDGPVAAGAEAALQAAPATLPPEQIAAQMRVASQVQQATAPQAAEGQPAMAVALQAQPVAAAPTVSSGEMPAAPRTRFSSPEDITRGEFLQRAQAVGVEPQVAEQLAPKVQVDDVTGWYDGRAQGIKVSTVQRAQEHVRSTGESAFYVDGDIVNLGGLNAFAKNDMGVANQHFRAMTDLLRGELETIGADVVPMRTGGDEIGAVVVNAGEPEVRAAMQRADAKIRDYASAQGLDQVPHTKAGRTDVGVGLHLGLAPIIPGLSLDEIFTRASAELNQSKEASNVAGIQTQVAGPVAPGRQAGGVAGSVEPTSAGDRPEGGEPAAQSGPAQAPEPGDEGPAQQVTPPDDDTPGPGVEIRYGKRRAAPMGRMPRTEDALDDRSSANTERSDRSEAPMEDAAEGSAQEPKRDGRTRAAQNQRPGTPTVQSVSETNRRSWFEQAFADAGLTPDEANLLPIGQQFIVLRKAVIERFGFKDIVKTAALAGRHAVDQMLDAHRNLQFLAHVTGLPSKAMSLNGDLSLFLGKNLRFLGAFAHRGYANEGAATEGPTVVMPRRSNSFAHEWMHALDAFLVKRIGETRFRMLSSKARAQGLDVAPGSVDEAFARMMNLVFFDQAELAARVIELEQEIRAAKSDSARAKAQAKMDSLLAGNARAKRSKSRAGIEPSDYVKNSAAFDPERADYWASAPELLARAFEAYAAWRVEGVGGTTEFIAKGDEAYLSMADERLAKTFPKAGERVAIFSAMDDLFRLLAKEQLIAQGVAANAPGNTNTFNPRQWNEAGDAKKTFGLFQRELAEVKRQLENWSETLRRPRNPDQWYKSLPRLLSLLNGPLRGTFRMLERQYGKQAPMIAKLSNLLVDEPGTQRQTDPLQVAQRQLFQKYNNRKANIFERFGVKTKQQRETIRDLLTGMHEWQKSMGLDKLQLDKLTPAQLSKMMDSLRDKADATMVEAAASVRRLYDDMWYYRNSNGLETGYASNFFNRVYDHVLIEADPDGFVEQAAKTYAAKFDKAIGADVDAVMRNATAMKRFAEAAQWTGDFEMVKRLSKALENVEKDPDALRHLVEGNFDTVRAAYSQRQAEAFLNGVIHGGGGGARTENGVPMPRDDSHNARTLPAEADELLKDYMVHDLDEGMTRYIYQTTRRVEFIKRFGKDGEKLKAMLDAIAKSGVPKNVVNTIRDIVPVAWGESSIGGGWWRSSAIGRSISTALNWIKLPVITYRLARMTFGQIPDSVLVGMQLADRNPDLLTPARQINNMVKSLYYTMAGVFDGKSVHPMRELLETIGVIPHYAEDHSVEARFGGEYGADPNTLARRLGDVAYRRTGTKKITYGQRLGAAMVVHQHLMMYARRMIGGHQEKDTIAALREAGVRHPDTFAAWLLQENTIPSIEDMVNPDGSFNEYGEDYTRAMNHLMGVTSLVPTAADRPYSSANPVGNVINAVTTFAYAFAENVIKRQAKITADIARTKGAGQAALYLSVPVVTGWAVYFGAHLAMFTLRQMLTNRDFLDDLDDDEREKYLVTGTLEYMLSLGALDRAKGYLLQARYEADAATLLLGMVFGHYTKAADKTMEPESRRVQKWTTNTPEFVRMQGIYELTMPWVMTGGNFIPTGALGDVGMGILNAYASSAGARDAFAEMMAGERGSKDPEKVAAREAEKAAKAGPDRGSSRGSSGRSEGRGTSR